MKGVLTVLCVAIIAAQICALADDWPHFRNGSGISAEKGINKSWKEKPPKVIWKVALSNNGFAGPAVAGGKVFIIDRKGPDDVVRALDINTGDPVWAFSYPEAEKKDNYGYARSTPAISDGKVYTLSFTGMLHCLNADDGTKVWNKHVVKDFNGKVPTWRMAISPVIDGDKLIVTPGGKDALVVALNKNTGDTIWKGGGSDNMSYCTPAVATIAGKKQYVLVTTDNVVGVDAETGRLLWSFPWKTRRRINVAMPIVFGNSVFITTGYKKGCALLRIVRGKAVLAWENKEMQAHFSSPIFYKGCIFGTGDPGFLMCLNPKTGKPVWKKKGFEKGGIILVDGTIIALDGKGGNLIMAALTPKGYKELGRIKPLGGQSWTAPILADGKLLVRNRKALVCLDLR